jgi:CubicO group peptidase (beta-lactamase class C family)
LTIVKNLKGEMIIKYFKNIFIIWIVITIGVSQTYFPPYGDWERKQAAEVGMSESKLNRAIQFAIKSESAGSRELKEYIKATLTKEPHGEIIGPTKPRGDMTGLIIKNGYIVAEWGDINRVDMTFSISKTYLSTVVGLAHDKGYIRNVHETVGSYMSTDHFVSDHNSKITWDHLLRQTSHWQGTLWDKPDWADRPPKDIPWTELQNQPLYEPGTFWKYNDVRVNLLALSALHVWRRPLPQILKKYIMDPIGASNTWRWHGYTNSWVLLDGQMMQSVSGGGHWGGGMWISAMDHARFGYLYLQNGKWNGKQLISENWIQMARKPTVPMKGYGYMNWFLNANRDGTKKSIPSAPETAVTFRGAGSNIIYIDWENDLLVVVRWINGQHFNEFIERLLKAKQ